MWRVLSLLCCFVLAFVDAVLAQHHFLPPHDAVLRTCEFRFGQPEPTLPNDVVLPKGEYDFTFIILGPRPPASGQELLTCSNFAWAELPANHRGEVTITPLWGGRQLDRTRSARLQFWDCNHSFIEYGIYATTSLFFPPGLLPFGLELPNLLLEQRLIGGGQLYGWVMPREARTDESVHGECVYRTTDPAKQYTSPSGWGRDLQDTTTRGGLRIAILGWSHNDVRFGHSGKDCADTTDCWWHMLLRISTRIEEGVSTP